MIVKRFRACCGSASSCQTTPAMLRYDDPSDLYSQIRLQQDRLTARYPNRRIRLIRLSGFPLPYKATCWSRDGTKIVFLGPGTTGEAGFNIDKVNADGSSRMVCGLNLGISA